MLNNKVVTARRIESKDGMIWVPPIGKPYWIEYPNSIRDLTDAEIKEYINEKADKSTKI